MVHEKYTEKVDWVRTRKLGRGGMRKELKEVEEVGRGRGEREGEGDREEEEWERRWKERN